MIIAVIGERCTGKSTVAQKIKAEMNAEVYTGRDYSRLAKNESMAREAFRQLLAENQDTEKIIVYVITEKEHLSLLPEKCVRVLCTASLDDIKSRFAERMNGMLPAPVSQMLERLHGSFDGDDYDLVVDSSAEEQTDVCRELSALMAG